MEKKINGSDYFFIAAVLIMSITSILTMMISGGIVSM